MYIDNHSYIQNESDLLVQLQIANITCYASGNYDAKIPFILLSIQGDWLYLQYNI